MINDNIISAATDANFETLLEKEPRLVLACFSASWCGPCKRMKPIIRAVATELIAKVKVLEIDVENSPALAEKYAIKGLPSFILFHKSTIIRSHVQTMTHSQLREFIEQQSI